MQGIGLLDEAVEFDLEGLTLVGSNSACPVAGFAQRIVTAGTGVAAFQCGFDEFRDWGSAFESELGELRQRHQGDELQEISSLQRDDWDVGFH